MAFQYDRWHRAIDGKPVARLSATFFIDADQTAIVLALASSYLGEVAWLEKVNRIEAEKAVREHLRRYGMNAIYSAFSAWDEAVAERLLTASQAAVERLWGTPK